MRASPGELLHLDTKKLGRFDRPEHRVTGDRTRNSRVGFSQVMSDEKCRSACGVLLAALRYYHLMGVRVCGVMTDNGSAYRSKRFAKLLRRLVITHKRMRPYTSRTNGKAERFIQTLLREWAYAYRYPSSDARTQELAPWMHHYNFHCPHSTTSHQPPASRLGFEVNNVLRNYS